MPAFIEPLEFCPFRQKCRLNPSRARISGLDEAKRLYKGSIGAPAPTLKTPILREETDADLKAMAQEELTGLEARLEQCETELKVLLLPKDPNDERNVILEIRAGPGGDEAALFVGDVFRMYTRYAESQR